MSTPYQCPVCGGSGKLPLACQYQMTAVIEETCHTCGGRGVIWSPPEPKPCEPPAIQFLGVNVYEYYYDSTRDATPKLAGVTA